MLKCVALSMLVAMGATVTAQSVKPDWAGESFISCHDTELFEQNNCGDGWCQGGSRSAYPLTAFRIVDLKIKNQNERLSSVILLLEGPGFKRVVVAEPVLRDYFPRMNFANLVFALLRGIKEIPKDWSSEQIAAIQGERVIRGMSRRQVECAVGFPQHENNYGDGPLQDVYRDGNLVVYFDASDSVVNVQTFR